MPPREPRQPTRADRLFALAQRRVGEAREAPREEAALLLAEAQVHATLALAAATAATGRLAPQAAPVPVAKSKESPPADPNVRRPYSD
jgi:hypothetical protein